MNVRAHYTFACIVSYTCQALQCWNAACCLSAIYIEALKPAPSVGLIAWLLLGVAVTAVFFVYLGAYRAHWRALYLKHTNPYRRETND